MSERNPPFRFNRFHAQRAVGAGPRKYDTDGLRPSVRRQRAEKQIDEGVFSQPPRARCESQNPLEDGHVRIRRDDEDMVRHYGHAVFDLGNR